MALMTSVEQQQAVTVRDVSKVYGPAGAHTFALDRITLDPQTVADTMGALLKYQDDLGALTPEVTAQLVAQAQTEGVKP